MRQFILNYQGTKYNESKNINEIDFNKYDTIIECFGGSFGLIRYLYYDLQITDKKFIVYDINKEMIDFYNHIKYLSKDERIDFVDKYNEINTEIFEKFKTNKDKSQITLKPTIEYLNNLDINKSLLFLLKHNIKSSPISRVYYKTKLDNDIFDKITFIHKPIQSINFNNYDEKTLVYLDPPYLYECNSYYIDDDSNNKSFMMSIINLFEDCKVNVMLVHSFNDLLHYVFKKWFYKMYPKKYNNTSKKVDHVIYFKILY